MPWATLCARASWSDAAAEDPGLQDWVRSRLARASQKAGFPADDGVDLRFSPDLVIATTSRALTGAAPMPAHFVLVGAALGPRRTDPGFRWDWWDPDRRHVLVTAGTL